LSGKEFQAWVQNAVLMPTLGAALLVVREIVAVYSIVSDNQ